MGKLSLKDAMQSLYSEFKSCGFTTGALPLPTLASGLTLAPLRSGPALTLFYLTDAPLCRGTAQSSCLHVPRPLGDHPPLVLHGQSLSHLDASDLSRNGRGCEQRAGKFL